jgi:anti-sigma factor RsiW
MVRDLTALADGTLPPKRREPLLRQVATSPKLARALKQQLAAIEAIRRLDTRAPKELHERIHRATREASAEPHWRRVLLRRIVRSGTQHPSERLGAP